MVSFVFPWLAQFLWEAFCALLESSLPCCALSWHTEQWPQLPWHTCGLDFLSQGWHTHAAAKPGCPSLHFLLVALARSAGSPHSCSLLGLAAAHFAAAQPPDHPGSPPVCVLLLQSLLLSQTGCVATTILFAWGFSESRCSQCPAGVASNQWPALPNKHSVPATSANTKK